jgi:hypothetical protein
MKTLKLCFILCIVLAFFCFNANAQKPIVPNHDEWSWGIGPEDGDLPCLTERIEGWAVMDGFFTNSSRGAEVYNWNYHEKGEVILTGETPGSEEYEARWIYNEKEMSFENGLPKNSFGVAHTIITHDGKLFMTINFQFRFIWNGNGDPIVVREVFNPKCK